jgi:uncharacterized membrane protein
MTTSRTLLLRMVLGVLSLLGLLVAVYLALYETGLSGSLVCPNTGCEEVNQSAYVGMFGIPIGVLGVIGYSIILIVELGWTTRRWVAGGVSRRPPDWARQMPWAYNVLSRIPVGLVLVGLAAFGFLFSLFLTYLELFVIRAICTWCVISAGLMTTILALALWAWFTEREVSP